LPAPAEALLKTETFVMPPSIKISAKEVALFQKIKPALYPELK